MKRLSCRRTQWVEAGYACVPHSVAGWNSRRGKEGGVERRNKLRITHASFLLVAVAIFNSSYIFPPATLVSRLSFFFKTSFVLGSLLVIASDFRLAAHAFNHCAFS